MDSTVEKSNPTEGGVVSTVVAPTLSEEAIINLRALENKPKQKSGSYPRIHGRYRRSQQQYQQSVSQSQPQSKEKEISTMKTTSKATVDLSTLSQEDLQSLVTSHEASEKRLKKVVIGLVVTVAVTTGALGYIGYKKYSGKKDIQLA